MGGEASELVGVESMVLDNASNEDGERQEFEVLLRQLRTEPADDEEVAAKFAMYEVYGGEVERMRDQLFLFHQEQRSDLPAAVVREMDREIKAVDSHQAMGIPDDVRDWFVYHMMKQAERNNRRIEKVLK